MSKATAPRFRALDRESSERLLARNQVGRIAYVQGGTVEIVPVHYVYDDGWIYGRTSPGRRLDLAGQHWLPVAFEVDEIEGLFRWRSVVVHGGLYIIPQDGAGWEKETHLRAVHLLRKLIPATFRDDDPVPSRTVLFRIAVQEIDGREALPGEEAAVPAVDA